MSVEFAIVASPTKRTCEHDECQQPSKRTVRSVPNDFKMPTIAEGLDVDAGVVGPLDLRLMTLAAETVGDVDKAWMFDRKEIIEKATSVWMQNTTPMWVSSSIYTDITTSKAYSCVALKFDDTDACRFLQDT